MSGSLPKSAASLGNHGCRGIQLANSCSSSLLMAMSSSRRDYGHPPSNHARRRSPIMLHPKPGEPSAGRLGSGLIRGNRCPHFDTSCHMARQKAHNGLVVETDMTSQMLILADEVEAAASRISDSVILSPLQI